jgi:hypothetical protein
MTVLFHLYSSEGCHLCEQAIELIGHVIPDHQIRVVDIIDANSEGEQNLIELYGVHIPVLERLSDNMKLFWPFEQSQVVELI